MEIQIITIVPFIQTIQQKYFKKDITKLKNDRLMFE